MPGKDEKNQGLVVNLVLTSFLSLAGTPEASLQVGYLLLQVN